jgi:hypothetical protein
MNFHKYYFIENDNPQIYTKEFKDWFGDWENNPQFASKVVDKNGKPKIMFHSTKFKFNKFKLKGLSSGYFFANHPNVNMHPRLWDEKNPYQSGSNIMAVYLNIRNLMEIESVSDPLLENMIIKKAIEDGYDGLYMIDSGTFVAFNSNQIKSATGNKGSFNKKSNNINEHKDVVYV